MGLDFSNLNILYQRIICTPSNYSSCSHAFLINSFLVSNGRAWPCCDFINEPRWTISPSFIGHSVCTLFVANVSAINKRQFLQLNCILVPVSIRFILKIVFLKCSTAEWTCLFCCILDVLITG